jgi:hypothetical protein
MRAVMGSSVEVEPIEVGGLPLGVWFDLHDGCMEIDGFGGLRLRGWPDGRSFLEQPSVTVEMFKLIGQEVAKAVADESKRNG